MEFACADSIESKNQNISVPTKSPQKKKNKRKSPSLSEHCPHAAENLDVQKIFVPENQKNVKRLQKETQKNGRNQMSGD